jgi:hypothetical protein
VWRFRGTAINCSKRVTTVLMKLETVDFTAVLRGIIIFS